MTKLDYKSSGVDIDLADVFVERIKKMVGKTYDNRTVGAVGGFAALYKLDEERLLASSTDGVGTKLRMAVDADTHNTIGIDLVAMCVNDLLCTGAKPLFFLDYFATGKLKLEVSEKVIEGIVEGCMQSSMVLIGGETAEMPGMYHEGDYDLAGFSVGEVYKKDLLDGSKVKAGDSLIGIASSGFHSNGYSLIRRIIDTEESFQKREEMRKGCLTPTRIYVKTFNALRQKLGDHFHGISHITGSGFLNIPRMNEKLDYKITQYPPIKEIPSFMVDVMERSFLSQTELAHTFNMGVGMVFATDKPDLAMKVLSEMGEKAWIIGEAHQGSGELHLP
jgi:phosphoribosylformylglycinamidine cyclo-ligase